MLLLSASWHDFLCYICRVYNELVAFINFQFELGNARLECTLLYVIITLKSESTLKELGQTTNIVR